MHQFSAGPPLHVHITEAEIGFSTKLTSSQHFGVTFSFQIHSPLQKSILEWLESYGRGAPSAIDFLPRQKLPIFTQTVLETLFSVPFGNVVSYSELASLCGSAGACRAVGTICRKNPFPLFIPCHRVVRNGGEKGDFAFGPFLKTVLLEFEQSTQG